MAKGKPKPPKLSQFLDGGDPPRLDATLLADYVAHEPTQLGRGADGEMYEYRDGIFVRDSDVITRRTAFALGKRWSSSVNGQVTAHMLNVDMPVVGLPDLPHGYLDYIVLENGIYWWAVDQLDNHSAALGATTKLPIVYDPIAIPHAFNEWLHQVLGDDEDMHRHVWELLGYLLMTGNPLQKIFLLFGEGGNGKGTLLRLIRTMLGRENYSSMSMHQLVDDRFATSGLYGKVANISGDLSSKFLSDPQILKEITGGDSIAASRKFGHSFEFVPYAVPIFASNEYFRTSDNSIGWRRRWEVIEFTRRVDTLGGFDERLLFDDIPGIFNLAMDGLRRLMTRGKFAPPGEAVEATNRLHDAADPFMLWLDDDEGVFRDDPQAMAACADVYHKYANWCRRNGYSALASGPFGQRLKQIGVTRTRTRQGASRTWCYVGIDVQLGLSDA
ncbi:phage/plasmid primase, P4 family [Microbacterium sp. BG28]|uniref:DNA primase family protein n=1 Tax=Microbacterium sp. BG28 TaxID=3097356 RepID=UPI002A5AA8B2|nr:phage/plasmid primase, P4 family [Microbacterium sp. BG28]MDY0827554.1 phage/plasmid primase, P4 family [Microbacterium sp. BG28]